jgi:hypothetical protein
MCSHSIINQATGYAADLKHIQAGARIEMHLDLLVFPSPKLTGLHYNFIKKGSYKVNSIQKATMNVVNLIGIWNVLHADILI